MPCITNHLPIMPTTSSRKARFFSVIVAIALVLSTDGRPLNKRSPSLQAHASVRLRRQNVNEPIVASETTPEFEPSSSSEPPLIDQSTTLIADDDQTTTTSIDGDT